MENILNAISFVKNIIYYLIDVCNNIRKCIANILSISILYLGNKIKRNVLYFIKIYDKYKKIVDYTPFLVIILFLLRRFYELSRDNFQSLKICIDSKNYWDIVLVQPNYFYDALFVIIFLYLLIYFHYKIINSYRYSDSSPLVNIVSIISYGMARGQQFYGYFLENTIFLKEIKYGDLIYVFSGGVILIWVKQKVFFNKKSIPVNDSKSLLFDNHPDKVQDLFGRTVLAKNIAEKIKHTYNPDGSIAVAVTGEWGSGKSTFLSIIEKELKDSTITIKITPGSTENKKFLVKDFFDIIASDLSKYDARISERVGEYMESLLELDTTSMEIPRKLFSFRRLESSKDRFNRLSSSIKNLNKQLIIFIDDLDRLDKKEIKEVLKLIRNTANFSNVTYIIAFDKNYVSCAVKTINDYRHENYLEKLFQLEINLPTYEEDILPKFLEEKLKLNFNTKSEEEYINLIVKTRAIINSFQSQRDISRFVNSFALIYNSLYDFGNNLLEVDFFDLFIIELIRLRYNKFYELLLKNHNNKKRFNDLDSLTNIEGYNTPIKELYEILYKNSLPDIDVKNELKFTNKTKKNYPFNEEKYRNRYFSYRLFNGDISFKRLKEILNNSQNNQDCVEALDKENYKGINLINILENIVEFNIPYNFNELDKLTFAVACNKFSTDEKMSFTDLDNNKKKIIKFIEFSLKTIEKIEEEKRQAGQIDIYISSTFNYIERKKLDLDLTIQLIISIINFLTNNKENYEEIIEKHLELALVIYLSSANKSVLALYTRIFRFGIKKPIVKEILDKKLQKRIVGECIDIFFAPSNFNKEETIKQTLDLIKDIWKDLEEFRSELEEYYSDNNRQDDKTELIARIKEVIHNSNDKR